MDETKCSSFSSFCETKPRFLRDRSTNKHSELNKLSLKREQSARLRKITKILKKEENSRTEEEKKILEESRAFVEVIEHKIQKAIVVKERCKECEDPEEAISIKCKALAQIIKEAKCLMIYTGAGISTSAQIPDYRGPNGVWTQLNKKGQILPSNDLSCAEPTFTHLAIAKLYRNNLVKHIVSQNCDGLHLRSGLTQQSLSEIHGNMYIEVCQSCKVQYFRDFDVTENTSFHRHKTGRKCRKCSDEKGDLLDTIVHFGEKGKFDWPYNWKGAQSVSLESDVILCLGTSLKILRKYQCLWPKKHNGLPKICIVNLQWTPKDSQSCLKINGKCDDVMRRVMSNLNISVDNYLKENDGLLHLYTPLTAEEEVTCNRRRLFSDTKQEIDTQIIPGWFGKGIRIKKK